MLKTFICIAMIVFAFFLRTIIYQNISENAVHPDPTEKPPITTNGKVKIYYHERSPYYITDGDTVQGLCADPITLAFETAGIEYQWEKTPPKRQLDIILENTSRVCAAGWFKTPAREKFSKFTLPIYRNKHFIAIARSDNDLIQNNDLVDKILSERRLRLLVKTAYSYGEFIDQKISHWNPVKVATSSDNTGMLKIILYHHADYFFISEEEAEDLLSKTEFLKEEFQFIHFTDMPMGSLRYIICSLKMDDFYINKLNNAIQQSVILSKNHHP